MTIPAHKTEYFIIENSNLQKKANTAFFAIPDFLCWSDVPTLEWVDDNNLLK